MIGSLTPRGSMCHSALNGNVSSTAQISAAMALRRLHGLPPKYGDPGHTPERNLQRGRCYASILLSQ
jgi:hypothetical protein